jgi:hypothetical protein
MRLTLRTLLAYMDDILDPADQEELGHKIESSPFATELIHRSRDAVRRLRVEKASLQSLARIDLEARSQLGMVAPTRQQVQLAREFAGVDTASTALGGRTAASAAPSTERVR